MCDMDFQQKYTPVFKEFLEHINAAGAAALLSQNEGLGSGDALLVIDMQNDFVPSANLKEGGRFAVAEGDLIAPMCAQLITSTMERGGCVVATRDYHPVDHCSFLTEGGPFPPHCVQGTAGSKLYPPVAEAMTLAIKADSSRANIAFKGFHEDIDSFGGLPYANGGTNRITRRGTLCGDPFTGCTCAPWTGCLLLKCSALHFDGDFDVDAAPDVLAVHQDHHRRAQNLVEKLKESRTRRLLVCGLALDYCVCDTALNARDWGFEEVVIVLDATRPAHIPGLGQFGSGFLQDPAELVSKLYNAGITLTSTVALTGERLQPQAPLPRISGTFPESLGPFGLERAGNLNITMGQDWSSFDVALNGAMQVLRGHLCAGSCTPFSAVTLPVQARSLAKIPAAARTFCFAYPLAGMGSLQSSVRPAFLSSGHDPNWRFICNGGFLYFSDEGHVLAANAVGTGNDLVFGAPQRWRREYTAALVSQNRFQPVTLTNLLAAGARHFAWVNAGETLLGGSGPWEPAKHGTFVYLFHEDPTEPSDRDIFFPVAEPSISSL